MRLLRRHPEEEAEVAESSADAPRMSPDPSTTTVSDRPGHAVERVRTDDVVVTPWSWPDAIVGLLGAALALVGAVVLVRAGINDTWYEPVEDVVDASHTPLLGVIEVGVGAALMFVSVVRARALAGLIGLAVAAAGALAIVADDELSEELAIENWWALVLLGGGVLVAALTLVPRRGRVERVVHTSDVVS